MKPLIPLSLFCLAASAHIGCAAPAQTAAPAPVTKPAPANATNVLFIAIDDLRPAIGAFGDTTALTPRMDGLAKNGTVFTGAYCQWPVCGPSRASLMTSLRPEEVGVLDLKTDMRAKDPDVLSLPQYFRQNGYTTAGTGKIYDPRSVDNKRDLDKLSWSIPFEMPNARVKDYEDDQTKPFVGSPDVPDADLMDGAIALNGIDLMQRVAKDKKPFFLAIGFKKPHLPFVAPQKYWNLYQRDKFELATYKGGIANDSGYVMHDSHEFRGYGGVPETGPIPDAVEREAIHGYYACASFVDAQLGLVLDELDRLDLRQNTAIVVWGDHGFHLGDHDMWGKHSTLETAARAPLMIIPPGGGKAQTTGTPVEFTDIFPTLCELSGLSVPTQLQGRSLKPIVDGRTRSVREGALTLFKNKGAYAYSYRTERYRYTEWINKNGATVARDLFDYQTDPRESVNVVEAPENAALVEHLAASLRRDGAGTQRLMMK